MTELGEEFNEVAQEVAETAGDVVELVESTAEVVYKEITKIDGRAVAVGVVGGVLIGAGTAWFITKRRLESKYQLLADREIEQYKEEWEARQKAREAVQAKPDLAEMRAREEKAVSEIIEREEYAARPLAPPVPGVRETPVVEVRNVLDEAEDAANEGWDWVVETEFRSTLQEGVQYVLHRDETGENAKFDIEGCTYFEGDDILTDDQGNIMDQDMTVGLQNLSKFGHGSDDPNTVWVINPELESIYEVTRDPRNYSEVIHGLSPDPEDLMHSERAAREGRRWRRGFDDD